MHPLIQLKTNTSLFLVAFTLVCFTLSPSTQAVLPPPPPDGGYPGSNTAEGQNALFNLTAGGENTAVGYQALFNNTTGSFNTANGAVALENNTTGFENTATGTGTLRTNTTGNSNTATGVGALVGNTTGFENTATGVDALLSNTTGDLNTATGVAALASNTTANNNTADGFQALLNNTTGTQNTASGESALKNNTTANDNTAVGYQVAFHNTTGAGNTAIGHHALFNNSTGSSNIALGRSAGLNLTTGSNNIDIGSVGGGGESNTIRIGSAQTRTFIKGISGAVVSGAAVVVNAGGQVGVAASSERFKTEIKPMDKASEVILALKPVTFRYKKEIDPKGIPQFGLVAEQVEKVNPALVVRDIEGKPYSVRYDQVNAMLLNEFLKEHRIVQEQARKLLEQRATITELKKGMETVIAHLKEQAAQIQKVSAQLEASKSAPQVVSNKNYPWMRFAW